MALFFKVSELFRIGAYVLVIQEALRASLNSLRERILQRMSKYDIYSVLCVEGIEIRRWFWSG
jgi:hypothetical protein